MTRRRGGSHRGWSVMAVVAALLAMAAAAVAQPAIDVDLQAERLSRRVAIDWSTAPEISDSLFGGYHVWRSNTPDPDAFVLLRRFQRRYPVSWTYSPAVPGARREFLDPDSVVTYRKIQINTQGDSALVRDYVGTPPFNGFPYFYALTWISECLSALNDTVWVDQPQPEILEIPGQSRYFFLADNGDTLDVDRLPCRRIDPRTNRPVGDTTFVYTPTVESEEPLRHYAIESTRLRDPVFPATSAKEGLSQVAAIPNPYISSAPWEVPGQRKIQFVNLTQQATVRIYTVGADLVRVIEHPAPGSPSDQGSVDWDLTNADGKLVESGIYIYQVETPGGAADFQGRLVIVR